MLLRKTRPLGILVAVLLATAAQAEGNVSFGGAPAVQGIAAAAKGAVQVEQLPGVSRVILSPVTSAQSEQAIKARVLPVNLNSGVPTTGGKTTVGTTALSASRIAGDTAATGPASIQELARALKNDPDRIYEYVRNNIEYTPTWGIQKGALGAVLDNQGTAFDQAQLMVSLLRQAGYTASFVKGRINLTPAQVHDWFGVDASSPTTSACAQGDCT